MTNSRMASSWAITRSTMPFCPGSLTPARWVRSRSTSGSCGGAGAGPVRLFRPPYGAYDRATLSVLARLRMLMVMWSVDPGDWRRPGARAIVSTVLRSVRAGAIVILHDGGGDRTQTIAALPHDHPGPAPTGAAARERAGAPGPRPTAAPPAAPARDRRLSALPGAGAGWDTAHHIPQPEVRHVRTVRCPRRRPPDRRDGAPAPGRCRASRARPGALPPRRSAACARPAPLARSRGLRSRGGRAGARRRAPAAHARRRAPR